jgi:hypothetical protein
VASAIKLIVAYFVFYNFNSMCAKFALLMYMKWEIKFLNLENACRLLDEPKPFLCIVYTLYKKNEGLEIFPSPIPEVM